MGSGVLKKGMRRETIKKLEKDVISEIAEIVEKERSS